MISSEEHPRPISTILSLPSNFFFFLVVALWLLGAQNIHTDDVHNIVRHGFSADTVLQLWVFCLCLHFFWCKLDVRLNLTLHYLFTIIGEDDLIASFNQINMYVLTSHPFKDKAAIIIVVMLAWNLVLWSIQVKITDGWFTHTHIHTMSIQFIS